MFHRTSTRSALSPSHQRAARRFAAGLCGAAAALATAQPCLPAFAAGTSLTETSLAPKTVAVAPMAGMVEAADHSLYAATTEGGTLNRGTIIKLTPAGDLSTIYTFPNTSDGSRPLGTLIQGQDGRLYGTTESGGAHGCGTVFALKTDGTAFSTLHAFGAMEGCNPYAGVVQTADGYLYGTAYSGAEPADYLGTLWRVKPDGSGFGVLRTFASADGANPKSAPILAADGLLYGTTTGLGSYGGGTVYAYDPATAVYSIVHAFAGGTADGWEAQGGLLQGQDGRLYGTTVAAGAANRGTVYAVNRDGSGFTLLHSFGTGGDGQYPWAGLVQTADGLLYGTTQAGGSATHGTVFQMDSTGATYGVLHSFAETSTDGSQPEAPLALASDGALYGTTRSGGLNNLGTVFKLALTSGPTAAPVSRVVVHRRGTHLDIHWTVPTSRGLIGFNLYAGSTRLNRAPIPLHRGHAYQYQITYTGRSTITLDVMLANGGHALVPAR